jgi:magnesium transporter
MAWKNSKKIAHSITYHPAKRKSLFRNLSVAEQASVFEYLSPYVRQILFANLKDSELVDLLDQMDMQNAENALLLIEDEKRRKKLITKVKSELKEKAEYFLRFHPKAALSLINFNYLLLSNDTTISEAADAIDEYYREVGKLPEVLIHKNGELAGEVPFAALVRESNIKAVGHFAVPVLSVSYQADVQDIINAFNKSSYKKVIVLDRDDSIIGIIYSDDALSLFGNQPTAVLYDFAGVTKSERPFDSIRNKVKNRYKWLIFNLATAFLAASVVSLFEDTLSKILVLAVYMPIVAGMGGNAATQTLAVIVRGITIGEISLRNGLPAIFKEVGAGFINGLINGVVVILVAILWNGNPMLGIVLAIAMIFNLIIAGFFGALIPLVMKAMGKDPATSATIFITTATDVFGFLALLGLATILLL